MPAFNTLTSEFMVPVDYHEECCDLAAEKFQAAERAFDKTMALQEVPSPDGTSVRYEGAGRILNIYRNLKESPQEAGPATNISFLKINLQRELPMTDEWWANAYAAETFTAGILHPRLQHFDHVLWRYDFDIEHYSRGGMFVVGPDIEAAMTSVEPNPLKGLLAKGDRKQEINKAMN